MSEVLVTQPPSTREAVKQVLETHRSKIERWKAVQIKEIDREADRELAQLERTFRSLSLEISERNPRPRQRVAGKRKSGAAAAGERREAIVRLLEERGEAMAVREVSKTLRISEFSTRSALRRLVEEGRARRVGTGSNTRYELRGRGPQPAVLVSAGPGGAGTIGGRILAVIQDRGYATLEELSQASGLSQDDARRACGGLLAEREVQMGRRGGQSVYLARRA